MHVRVRCLMGIALGLSLWACHTAGFKRSYAALDSRGDRKRTVFFPDDEAIYGVAEMASGAEDVEVTGELRLRALIDPEQWPRAAGQQLDRLAGPRLRPLPKVPRRLR